MNIYDIFLDTIVDSIKLLPFLLITYIILETIEHKASSKMIEKIQQSERFGPIIGSLFGLIPQCGFSTIASSLYSTRIITLGTLVAIYLSTSDEMLPLMISYNAPYSLIVKILLTKLIIGLIVGLIIDLILRKEQHINIEHFCEEEHCDCDGKDHGILYSALVHTIKIFTYIFIISFLLNMVIGFIGHDTLMSFAASNKAITLLTTTLVGLIPNCGASIVVSELYLTNVITYGTLIAGLLANAGVGLLVLFRVNHNLKENMLIIAILVGVSLVTGFILNII